MFLNIWCSTIPFQNILHFPVFRFLVSQILLDNLSIYIHFFQLNILWLIFMNIPWCKLKIHLMITSKKNHSMINFDKYSTMLLWWIFQWEPSCSLSRQSSVQVWRNQLSLLSESYICSSRQVIFSSWLVRGQVEKTLIPRCLKDTILFPKVAANTNTCRY